MKLEFRAHLVSTQYFSSLQGKQAVARYPNLCDGQRHLHKSYAFTKAIQRNLIQKVFMYYSTNFLRA